ncbi:MAG: DUF1761 domain-containing protein [Parvularculaceae bacterium]
MPKILGLNLLGVLVGSLAFYFVGFLWYGVLFSDAWMATQSYEAADFEGQNQAPYMIGGFLITVLQVVGLGLVLKWRGVANLPAALATAGTLWVLFALPFAHYAYLYAPHHSPTLLMIDASHLLVGWLVAAIGLMLFWNKG